MESAATASTLPRPPASRQWPRVETDRREAPAWTGARVVSLGLVGILGIAVGVLLGAALFETPVQAATRVGGKERVLPATSGSIQFQDLAGAERAERVIAAVLAAAPACTPEIRMAGAPASEHAEFIEEAERLATDASDEQGLKSVRWKVTERDGQLFGVLYGERCD